MPRQAWICSKCGKEHRDEAAAVRCEEIHKEPIGYQVLSWGKDAYGETLYYPDRIRAKLQFGERITSAIYQLAKIEGMLP